MSQEKRSIVSEEATLPPPRPADPPTTAGPGEATFVAPPPQEQAGAGNGDGETNANLHTDATLPPPAGGNPLLAPTMPLAPAVPLAPSDATLDPSDPKVRAFHEEAQQAGKGPAVATGASFGHYELIAPIAKGGMGIVYKARQRNLNRVVAIKMILSGQFADQQDVDRFYAEAEAAAALSHPNIVAIHEIGEVQGQHFFSMDYVDGQSLAALVQESPLPPRRAAEMVRTISETMQFAHDSGIIHRDLKPGNVLLDKKQRPLITDFGLAKQVTNQSQMTMAGAVIGTPSYMPPEQAAGKLDEVGPWSDLYSLGAILYECLTGRPPFRAATPFETIRQVMESEPLSPRLVNPSVPRDLETICLKCLQKERLRRYESAQEFADELGRFLRGEPIKARPISQVGRLWRLCKRNPVTSSVIAAAVFILVAATIISTGFYFQTAAALALSEQSDKDARGVVDFFLTRFSEDALLNQPGMQKTRKELFEKALTLYQKFLTDRGNDPSIQDELAGALFRVGAITEVLQSLDDALPSYSKAREMQERLLVLRPNDPKRLKALGDTLVALGTVWVRKKDFDAARKDLGRAVEIRKKLVSTDTADTEYQRTLANAYMNIGLMELNAGRLAAARQPFEEAQKIREGALQRDRANVKIRRDLGKGYYNLGTLDQTEGNRVQAETHFSHAVAVFEELTAVPNPDLDNQSLLAICYRLLGDVLSDDRVAERRTWYEKSLDRLEPLARQNPDVIGYQTARAEVLLNLFELEMQAGNAAAARAALQRARDIYKPLVERFPGAPRYQRDLAVTLRELAIMEDAAGEAKTAADDLAAAIRYLTALVEKYPQEADYTQQLEDTKAVMLTGSATTAKQH
jgi:serine/threonine protein kinase/tetratricopeptide (TPR) repeat protein